MGDAGAAGVAGMGGEGGRTAATRSARLAAAATPDHPALAAVLGSPVAHSMSPVMHSAAYAELGLAVRYTAVHCAEDDLPAMTARMRTEPGWLGVSLTMPLKTAVLGLLDEIDPTAEAIGAVNTVVVGDGGHLAGYNTDVVGIGVAVRRALRAAVPGQPLVLGAGGTARAAIAALAACGCPHTAVVARRAEAAAQLAVVGEQLGIQVTPLPWDLLATGLPTGPDLVIATTPVGATDDLATRRWPPTSQLVELLYHPWPTALAAAAYRAGARVASGLEILAAQAVGQVEHFTGRTVPAAVLLAAGQTAHDARLSAASPAASARPAVAPGAREGAAGG